MLPSMMNGGQGEPASTAARHPAPRSLPRALLLALALVPCVPGLASAQFPEAPAGPPRFTVTGYAATSPA